MRELLIGCGNKLEKQLWPKDGKVEWDELITLDIDPSCKPDVIHDLNEAPWPFDDSMFDCVHAYEVLEHLGRQGDVGAFFLPFAEIYRILKPEGLLFASCPCWDGAWAWGDPGHTQIISKEKLVFLNQDAYEQVGKTSMTDYRRIYTGNLVAIHVEEKNDIMTFVLQARK